MCKFFSFVTEPEQHGGQRFYCDWEYRKDNLKEDDADSHSHICNINGLDEDKCNAYEYNPLTRDFVVDKTVSPINDCIQAEEWVNHLDWKKIVEPLIIKPIIGPFALPKVDKVTPEQIIDLRLWASVRASVGASVWDSVWASVWASVWDSVWASVWASVWNSVRDSVWDSVRASVWDSVGAYISTFFDIKYKFDFMPAIRLWKSGLVPSFDGTTWRLHSGEKADIVYLISDKDLKGQS